MVRRGKEQSGSGAASLRLMQALGIILLVVMGLQGCAAPVSVRPPSATEIDRVKQRQLAVVLFQLKASIGGKPVAPLAATDSNNAFRIYLASLDELGAPKQIRPASPSEGTAADGWHYLMLAPGVYYLLVLPPGVEQNPPAVAYHAGSARYGRLTQYQFTPGRGGFWSPELMSFVLTGNPPADFRELHGFWFQVPENRQVIYLGSLSTECRSGRGLFGSLMDSCSDFRLANDPQSAQAAVSSFLPEAAVDAQPFVPYGKPRAGTNLRELSPVNVVARGPEKITAAFTGAELAPWGVIPGTGRAIAVHNLLAVGIELAARASADVRAGERAVETQPCIDRLSGTVGTIDYSARIASALGETARAKGIALELNQLPQTAGSAQARHIRYRLTTSVPILRLREVGQPQNLALELALEMRLEAVDSKSVGYYGVLYYAPELPIQSPLAPRSSLYARFLPQRAKPRAISEWCGPDGAALLAEEIQAALKQIAAQIIQDLD